MKQSRYISRYGLPLLFFSLALSVPVSDRSAYAQVIQQDLSVEFNAEAAYKKNCSSCHDHGVMGAPKPGDQRFSKDIETLVTNAINGIGKMPARGHAAFLTDDQVRSIVEYMEQAQE